MLLQKMEYFIAVAEELNVSHAAQKLNITQPHLSRLIQSLEDELKVTLIIRTRKGVILTEAGKQFYEHSKNILEEIETIKRELRNIDMERKNLIMIIALESTIPWVSRMRDVYCSKEKDVQVNISSAALNSECFEQLSGQKADLAFVREPLKKSDIYNYVELGYEPWIIAFREDSVLGQNTRNVQAKELEGIPILLPYNEKMIADFHIWMEYSNAKPKIFGTWSTLHSAVMLANENLGCAVCPAGAKNIIEKAGLKYRKLQKNVYPYQTMMCWKKREGKKSRVLDFVHMIEELLASMDGNIYRMKV